MLAIAVATFLLAAFHTPACLAGKNAGGALIVHTHDAYVFSAGTVCTTTYSTPASCEEANTRSDKDVGTVVWLLAAFPDTSSPAVSGIYFGIDYDDSLSVEQWKMCAPAGSIELPDSGWPNEGRGNAIAFGTPVVENRLFPFYAFKIDGGTYGSYFGTAINPTGGYAAFIDDGFPPEIDPVTRFGTVRWYEPGENECPDTRTQEGDDQSGTVPLTDLTIFSLPGVHPSTIYNSAGKWTFLVTGIPASTITDVILRLDSNTIASVGHDVVGATSSLWDFDYPRLRGSDEATVLVVTERDTLARHLTVIEANTPSHDQVPQGEISVRLTPHVFSWVASRDPMDPDYLSRPLASVACADDRLSEMLTAYGVSRVAKVLPGLSDADSLLGVARQLTMPARMRSAYVLQFQTTHSIFSFIELLGVTESVVGASWLPTESPQSDCPVWAPGTVFEHQWELLSSNETTSDYNGLRANYAWCSGYAGQNAKLYLIDVSGEVWVGQPSLYGKLSVYSDKCYNPGPYSNCSKHATECATMMVGRFPGGTYTDGIVGVAPDAMLTSYYRTGFYNILACLQGILSSQTYDPTLAYIALPFDWLNMSAYTKEDFDSIAESLRDMNAAMFAPAHTWHPLQGDNQECYPGHSPFVLGVGGVPRWNASSPPQTCDMELDDPPGGYMEAEVDAPVKLPCGYFDAYATLSPSPAWDGGREPSGEWRHGLSFSVSLAAASAPILQQCFGYTTAVDCYAGMANASYDPPRLLLDVCQPTGIHDVSGFEAVGGDHADTLRWFVDDASGIDEFSISQGPLCWGAYDEVMAFPPGEHTEDGMNYQVVLDAEIHREYWYKLVVTGDEGAVVFNASCWPEEAEYVQIPAAPTGLELQMSGPTEGQLSWNRLSNDSLLQYWIYGGPQEGLSPCGPSTASYGDWLLGVLGGGEAGTSCDAFVPGKACWLVSDLIPGMPYSFRVAVVKRQSLPQGAVEWSTQVSEEMTDYGVQPASVGEEQAPGEPRVSVFPTPFDDVREITVRLEGAGPQSPIVDVFDVGGRRVPVKKESSRRGETEVVVSLVPETGRLAPGVYFINVAIGSGQRSVTKVVVIR